MPRPIKTEAQEKDLLLRALIEKNKVLLGIHDNETLAKKLMVCPRTMYNKLDRPETLTLKELRRLCSILHFTEEEKKAIM